ncbi:MAG: hypothetical protein GY716_10715 [bacterium]|nr:hypothetical protein [bacterium]
MGERDRIEALGETAGEAIERMVRELMARKPGGHLLESSLRDLELRVPLLLRDSQDGKREFARRIAETVDRLLDDAVQQVAAFRPGRTYCHRCASAVCEHSQPASGREVFCGYAPTGTPRWIDFAQYCLDRRHPEVDRLYATPPALLTLVQTRTELGGEMLNAFRDGTYELMGQVTAGFFAVQTRAEEGRGVVALTAQAAAAGSRRGRLRLGLNLLGRAPGGEPLDALWDREVDLPWRRAVRWAQHALESLPPKLARRDRRGGFPPALEARIDGILRGLGRRLEQGRRARSRRTNHAEGRHASGQRPTRKAVDDARGATLDTCMVDDRSGALVVLGDRGRTHFFTTDGRLVSSVRYSKDSIARKVKAELWRPASSGDLEQLLANLPES